MKDVDEDMIRLTFGEGSKQVESLGLIPISPLNVAHAVGENKTREEYLAAGLIELEQCEYIYMLRSWERSEGARLELEYARLKYVKVLWQSALDQYKQKPEFRKQSRRVKCEQCNSVFDESRIIYLNGVEHCPVCAHTDALLQLHEDGSEYKESEFTKKEAR
jgi:hypothetical protein